MKANVAIILYKRLDPSLPAVKVVELSGEGRSKRSMGYNASTGAAYTSWRDASPATLALRLFIEFNSLVVREGIEPRAVHEAFLEIDEYRQLVAPGVEGGVPTSDELMKALGIEDDS